MNPTTKVVGREFSDDAFNVTSRRGRRSGTGRLGRRRRGADFTGRFSDQKAGNLAVEHVEARTRGSQVASYLAAAGNGPAGQEECSRRTGSIERRALLAPMAVSLKLAYDAPSACDDRQHEQTRQDADGTRAAAPIAADAGVQELASPRAEFNLLNNQHPMPARQTTLLRGPDRPLTPLEDWLEIGLRFGRWTISRPSGSGAHSRIFQLSAALPSPDSVSVALQTRPNEMTSTNPRGEYDLAGVGGSSPRDHAPEDLYGLLEP